MFENHSQNQDTLERLKKFSLTALTAQISPDWKYFFWIWQQIYHCTFYLVDAFSVLASMSVVSGSLWDTDKQMSVDYGLGLIWPF